MSEHTAENDAPKPSWVKGGRVISNHDVTRPGGRETPCFCWANSPHPEGQDCPIPPAVSEGGRDE
jgi:hypothetical protein